MYTDMCILIVICINYFQFWCFPVVALNNAMYVIVFIMTTYTYYLQLTKATYTLNQFYPKVKF